MQNHGLHFTKEGSDTLQISINISSKYNHYKCPISQSPPSEYGHPLTPNCLGPHKPIVEKLPEQRPYLAGVYIFHVLAM